LRVKVDVIAATSARVSSSSLSLTVSLALPRGAATCLGRACSFD